MADSELSKPTAGAVRAMGLAQLVNKVFASERVKATLAGHPGFRLQMAGPEGPSTSAAELKDRLDLVSLDKTGDPAPIRIGSADPGMSHAELRGFERLRALHAAAPGGELPLDRADYERLLAKLEQFFDRQGVPVTVVQDTAASAAPKGASARSGIPVAVWIVGGVVFVAVLALLALLRSR
ncbi:MAG TPA: hypothetical protein VGI39_05260 [Polyangiaceae bacterium]|jgi:hypothetical protein